ncbi:GIY-YIG nuclease family protein [Amycolatopsis sp. MJM2582]|uniref:GIY-YIG nuclease family protein n=1 Tax=Amycolatopsis sp. MJM2582 TaxID=1427749 RepID=UPI00068E70F0|nr:GIY-YIG nuclease family protein [Amycolatopsis sp. MJM2582]
MTMVIDEKNPRDSQLPVTVLPWLLLSEVSSHAVRLYCLYKLFVHYRTDAVDGLPRSPKEFAAVLRLDDIEEYHAVHQELIAVGAVTEEHRIDDAGLTHTTFLLNDLSPSQIVKEDERSRQLTERYAAKYAAANTPGQACPLLKGFVYVIGQVGSNVVKIGYSIDVSSRLKSLQTSNPNPLEVRWYTPGDRRLEDALHLRFVKYRTNGEWFDFGHLDPVVEVRAAVSEFQRRRVGDV